MDGFPEDLLTLPTVSIEAGRIMPYIIGVGDKYSNPRVWHINIFAKNKSQRDDIVYKILHALEDSYHIPVYDYDEGFPPDISPSKIGGLVIEDISADTVRINPNLVSKLYYRALVSFSADYNKF